MLKLNVYFTGLALFLLTSCQTSAVRNLASDKNFEGVPALAEPQIHSGSDMYVKKRQIQLHDGSKNQWKAGKLNLKKHSLKTVEEMNALQAHLDALVKNEGDKNLSKGAKRSIREIQAILNSLIQLQATQPNPEIENDVLSHLSEVVASFNYNFQLPVKEQIWVLEAPIKILGQLSHTTMSDKAKAANNITGPGEDSSKQNPVNSSFWVQPTDLEQRNMYYGFYRKSMPVLDKPCTYKDPKTSFGTHGGFEIKCDAGKFKIKFGNETKTEPFNSRILWALGYNVTPIDYTKGVQVVYDRRVMTEYNMRKDLTMNFHSLLGFSYYKHHLQKVLDPFTDAIASARLADGRTISSEELKKQLLMPSFLAKTAPAVITDGDINAEFEKQVAFLILKEGSIEGENESEQSLGPWSWNDFDHPKRRELRGFSVFASFLNMFDVRTDNNRLRVAIDSNGQKRLKHYVSDVGSGLGNASGLVNLSNGQVNDYPWEFMRKRPTTVHRGPKNEIRRQTPYAPVAYQPLERNEAFERAQAEDAIWAARYLARISEDQILDALIASGFSAAETKLLLEKMISRRQNLLSVFNLQKEYAALMSRPVNRAFDYNPKAQDVPKANGSRNGHRAEATGTIQKGKFVP